MTPWLGPGWGRFPAMSDSQAWQAGRQAGKQACMAGRQASKQASMGRQAGRQAGSLGLSWLCPGWALAGLWLDGWALAWLWFVSGCALAELWLGIGSDLAAHWLGAGWALGCGLAVPLLWAGCVHHGCALAWPCWLGPGCALAIGVCLQHRVARVVSQAASRVLLVGPSSEAGRQAGRQASRQAGI